MYRRPAPEIELEDVDGNLYPLSFPERMLQAISGMGMPPIAHWTTRAPFQTGQSHWGYAIQPRIINAVLYHRGCTRADMYAKRRANIQMMNPMEGPHKLHLHTPPPDPRHYELHNVWVTGGYELSSQDQPVPTVQTGAVQLTAYDPIWKWVNAPLDAGESRDSDGRICVEEDTWTQEAELTLPFTGPFLLGTTVSTGTLTCVNDGSWAVKPVITVEGPTEDWALTNGTLEMLWDGYTIAAGEIVTIDIPAKTVTNAAGANLITYIGGDFGTFSLSPGTNSVEFWSAGSAVNGTTTVAVCWYVEVLGV